MGKDCLLGDLNGWIGDRVRTGITGAFWSSRRERKGEDSGEVLC